MEDLRTCSPLDMKRLSFQTSTVAGRQRCRRFLRARLAPSGPAGGLAPAYRVDFQGDHPWRLFLCLRVGLQVRCEGGGVGNHSGLAGDLLLEEDGVCRFAHVYHAAFGGGLAQQGSGRGGDQVQEPGSPERLGIAVEGGHLVPHLGDGEVAETGECEELVVLFELGLPIPS